MSTIIEDLITRKILNSQGDDTIEVDVITSSGFGRASASLKGNEETINSSYTQNIDQTIKKLEEFINPELIGLDADFQEEIDGILYNINRTNEFNSIGRKATFAISLANIEAAANSHNLLLFQFLGGLMANELPLPLGKTMCGGPFSISKSLDMKEILILPLGAESFFEAVSAITLIHKQIGKELEKKGKLFGGQNCEGAWVTNISDLDALNLVSETCEKVGNELNLECRLGIDVAAPLLWNEKKGKYVYTKENIQRDPGEQLDFILDLVNEYHLVYLEDPFHENDLYGYGEIKNKVKNCLISGDILFNIAQERLKLDIKNNIFNSTILQLDRFDTISELISAIELAKRNGCLPILSSCSGDTCDWHISHLAVAFKCPIMKTGIMEGTEIAKINELIRIEELLGSRAKMACIQII